MKITPLRTNIDIYQGGTLDVRFVVYDDETGALADLTGYTGYAEVRDGTADDSGTVELTPTVMVDTVNSIVQLYEDNLADLRAVGVPDSGWLYYDVYITGTGGDRWLIAYGQARVIPEYARPA